MLPAELIQTLNDSVTADQLRAQIQQTRLDAETAVAALEQELRALTGEVPRARDPLDKRLIGERPPLAQEDRAILRLARLAEAMKPAAANSQYARRAREEVLKALVDLGVSSQAEVDRELGV